MEGFDKNIMNDLNLDLNLDLEFLNNITNESLKTENFKTEHKILKGRARTKQLKSMTQSQKDNEKKLYREKNRISAKHYRNKKNKYMDMLKTKVELYEKYNKQQKKEIHILKLQVQKLKDEIIKK